VALGPQRSTGCLLSNTFIVILTLGLTTSLPGVFVRHIESLNTSGHSNCLFLEAAWPSGLGRWCCNPEASTLPLAGFVSR